MKLIGRKEEFEALTGHLAGAVGGEGNAVLVSGEAGIGKSRLIEELRNNADGQGINILSGAAASDTIHPFLIFSDAIESELDKPLFHEREFVSFTEIFAVNRSGLLIAQASSEEEGLDADIFAGMLSAVQDFVRDSFDSSGTQMAGLGRLEYGDMKIIIEHGENLFLTAVFKGSEHADMKGQLKRTVAEVEKEHGRTLAEWSGRMEDVVPVQDAISLLAESKFLVRKELKGLNLHNERVRIASRVLEFLTALAAQKPVLMLLEDLHWADESSLFVLSYLARNIRKHKICLLGTLRPAESQMLSDTMEAMKEEGTFSELALDRLGGESVSHFIDQLYSPNDFPAGLIERLAGQCEGNPFFVTEMLRQMAVEGNIERQNGMYTLVRDDYLVPNTVEDVVYRRLDSFEPDAISMAEYSSCIGRQFPTNVALSAPSIRDSETALQKVQNGNVIARSNGSAEFTHAIFQEVIYRDIGDRWKIAYHKSIGEYYESVYGGREDEVMYELARHFSRSNEYQKAYDYCRKAAEKAESSFATEQAIQYYDLMLAVLYSTKEPERERKEIELLLKKGRLLVLGGEWDKAKEVFDKCLALSEKHDIEGLIAESKYSLGSLLIDMSEYKEAFVLAEDALGVYRKIDNKDGEAKSLWVMGNSHYHLGEYEPALDYFTKSRDMHDANGNLDGKCVVQGNIGTLLYRQGKMDEALAEFELMLELAKGQNNQRMISRAIGNQGFVHYSKGNHDSAMECYSKQLVMAEKMGDRLGISHAVNNMGIIHFSQRNHEKAMEHYHRDLEISEELGDKRGTSITLSNIGLVLEHTGRYEEALEYHLRSIALAEKIGDKQSVARVQGNIGNIYYCLGDYEMAKEKFEIKRAMSEELGDKRALCISLGSLGNVYKPLGDMEASEKAYSEAIEIAEEVGLRLYVSDHSANKARLMVALGRFDEALELAHTAIDLADELERSDISFRSRITLAVATAPTDREKAIDQLEDLLPNAEKKEYIAEVHYELYKITGDEEHAAQSAALYTELYKETPNITYKERAEELEGKS